MYKKLFYLIILSLLIIEFTCKSNPAESKETGIQVIDIDGNIYKTVKMGNQIWMAENLKVTHYRNGMQIQSVTDSSIWKDLKIGAYCNYKNNPLNGLIYGRLYNWYAVIDSQNIAPKGWHVPTDEEWKELEVFLGMSQSHADSSGQRGTIEGGKMKSTGTIQEGDGLWRTPNTGATNDVGFSALPGGSRIFWDGSFRSIGKSARFWTSTEIGNISVWYRTLSYSQSGVGRINNPKISGSIRCVKD